MKKFFLISSILLITVTVIMVLRNQAILERDFIGKKVSLINTPDSSVALYEGIVMRSEAENFSGSSLLCCRYRMENDRVSDIDIIVPMSIAMNSHVGDTVYFQRTDVTSSSQYGTYQTTFIGVFYDTESLGKPKHIQRFKD